MTTLQNRPNTALLVIDVQVGNLAGAHQRDEVVANISDLVEKARRERVAVVWVQHSDEELEKGSEGWRIVPELKPADADPLVEKHYADSFEDTTLETVLSGLGVGRLVVAGAQTDECIRATLHGAVVRGYDAIAGQRCPYDGRPHGMGSAAAGRGHRAHEPVLDLPPGAGADGGNRQGRGGRLRRPILTPRLAHQNCPGGMAARRARTGAAGSTPRCAARTTAKRLWWRSRSSVKRL